MAAASAPAGLPGRALPSREIAPGADVKVIERILPRFRALRRDRGKTLDLADVTAPLMFLLVDVAERGVLDRDHACDVWHALRQHRDVGPAGGVAVHVDRE